MKIKAETGISYRDATESVISEIIERYNVNRRDALKLFAESIIRNCVQDELFGEIDFLLGREEQDV